MSESNSNSASISRRCAACKYLRRRCSADCILSPYFPASHPQRFACVHRIFGASNVARMLQILPVHQRAQAAESISFEAHWRAQDPVYGCVRIINMLQHEIYESQQELARTQAQLAMYTARQPTEASSVIAQPQENLILDNSNFLNFQDLHDLI
ncbi:Phosphoribosyltransferase-like protein [Dioscorea alata]|uniref:Phosphoribosyltransferase-like protein n=1 Tax=Dioscorea alata TaxID=55571 RepID=A0ACB7VKL3_DIOAL|nr:Phosphoribosyltransferase-like protein [Dioscorea alata]